MTRVAISTSDISMNDNVGVGEYFLNINSKDVYVIATPIDGSYVLINLKNGMRYMPYVKNINDVFDGDEKFFVHINKISINIGG